VEEDFKDVKELTGGARKDEFLLDSPQNLKVEVFNGTQVGLSWEAEVSSSSSSGIKDGNKFVVELESLESGRRETFYVEDSSEFLLNGNYLESGGSYQVRVYSRKGSQLSTEFIAANFTTS
jgi:hypothetical protein